MAVWRVLPLLSAQERQSSGHAAIDSSYFDRKNASKHYCRRTNYRVQTFKSFYFQSPQTEPFPTDSLFRSWYTLTCIGVIILCHSMKTRLQS